ncbi:hypothetical protein HMPREF9565_00658 [Cutibacterium acnes HL053PA2]|nr:hypothetical protein HMPREF9565_00658 [Cutibacterium acnes HL053PA2]
MWTPRHPHDLCHMIPGPSSSRCSPNCNDFCSESGHALTCIQ